MKISRPRFAVLITGIMMMASISMAATAQAQVSSSATTSHVEASGYGCSYDVALLNNHYIEADKDRGLAWTARNSATSGAAVILEPQSSTSQLDCFKTSAGDGNSTVVFQLANSDLCLNIAGNSHKVGAWVILWPCIYSENELFTEHASGLADGSLQLKSYSSGLCIDLDNGYNRGSILEQKSCGYQDEYQSWYPTN